jgi:hypothetical protein
MKVPLPRRVLEQICNVCETAACTGPTVDPIFFGQDGRVGCSSWDLRRIGHNGAEEEVEVFDEDLDEEVADLLDTGDVQEGEEGENAGVF